MSPAAALGRTLLALAGGLLAVTAIRAAEPVAAPAGVLLRYAFGVGDDLASTVAHRALTETTMNGVTQSVETSTDSTRTWKVVAVDEAGAATLEQVVDEVTMTSRSSDQGEVRWSSADLTDPPPGYEGVRQSLGVPLVRLRVAADGRILELDLNRWVPADQRVEVSLTAVLEDPHQSLSYWAWKHSGDEPDFHLRGSFQPLDPEG